MQLASFLSDSSPSILAFTLPRGYEWIIIGIVALLIFGKRLPDVGRSLGKGIVEFKKGIRGLEDEIDEESSRPSSKRIPDASASRQELPLKDAREEQRAATASHDE